MASDPIILALVGVPAGLFFFIKGFGKWSHYNTITNTPTSKVEAIAAGFVEVYGEAVPKGEYMLSPFVGRECTFYKYEIQELHGSGKHRHWDVIKRENSRDSFFIEDDTGRILVDPGKAELDVVDKKIFHIHPGDAIPPKIAEFLKEVKLSDGRPALDLGPLHIGGHERMYVEWVIEKGQKVFVTGTAVPNEGVQSDKHEDMLMITKGDFNKFFYISDRAEKDVLGGMRNSALLYLIGGGLAALIGLAYIFLRMNIL
jgi:hypothetical protein